MKVFYNQKQNATSIHRASPSAGKPKLVFESWKQLGNVEKMKIRPLKVDSICLAHDSSYVKGILDCRIKNGFGNKNKDIADSLPWTSGSFAGAAKYALENRVPTFSPTSGFHHARSNKAAGFCTFNGLMISAIMLHKLHGAKRIGILDLDSHVGDGTEEIMEKTASRSFVEHYSLGFQQVDTGNNEQWLCELPDLIEDRFADCDILFYQSGMDSHCDDPYVNQGHFNSTQMEQREILVFETCKKIDIPVVTNLAGGYQVPTSKIIELHDLTAKAYFATWN